jgi:hypothetical protein
VPRGSEDEFTSRQPKARLFHNVAGVDRWPGSLPIPACTSLQLKRHFAFAPSSLREKSPFDPSSTTSTPSAPTTKAQKKLRSFVPRKAAVNLSDKSRTLFKRLLENPSRPEIVGVLLNYDQSGTGEPRMVFSFSFVTKEDLAGKFLDAEGVSLELDEKGNPKSPQDSLNDGLPKLYVDRNAFLKVLGATVDVDVDTMAPVLHDREGNKLDPNDM